MKKLFQRFACFGLLAGALGGGALVAESVAAACQVPVVRPDSCTCRNFQPTGYIFCTQGRFGSCAVSGDCNNGGGSGGGGEPL